MVNPKGHSAGAMGGINSFIPGATATVNAAVNTAKALVAATMSRMELMKTLAAFENEPAAAKKAVRDMSDQEAFDVMMHLVYKGEIILDEPIKTDVQGKVVQPRPGQQLKVRTRMAGVEYNRASNVGFVGNRPQATFTPKPAFALVLYRLAQRLGGGYYGATKIVWGGIGHGTDGKIKNCHEIGTCVEFYGAYTRHGTFDVLNDWAKKPVFGSDGKQLKPADGDRWGNAHSTSYRLRFGDPGLAYFFFQEVYSFAVEQCTVGSSDVAELKEGQAIMAGNIIHPDYPTFLRRTHQEHMHFQLGNAFV
jgi:hypothetical protein